MLMQKPSKVPPIIHPYGTRSKTKVDSASLTTSYEEENRSGVIGNLFNCVMVVNRSGTNYVIFVLYTKFFIFYGCIDPNRYYYYRVSCGHGC